MEIVSYISYHEELKIENAFRVENTPENYGFSNENIYIKQDYRINKNTVITDSKFIVKTSEIPLEKYSEIKNMQNKVDELARQQIIIKRR